MSDQVLGSLGGLDMQPLLIRLGRELVHAGREFKENPVGYLRALFARGCQLCRAMTDGLREVIADPRGTLQAMLARDRLDQDRMKVLYVGVALSSLLFASLICGWVLLTYFGPPADMAMLTPRQIIELNPLPPPPPVRVPKAERAGGGGGGGLKAPAPASRGRLPEAALHPPIIAPVPPPPAIDHPALPVVPTIQAQPDLLPAPDRELPLGLLTGLTSLPSAGAGTGAGYGSGSGGGVGSGHGTGYGRGEGWNTGSGQSRLAIGRQLQVVYFPLPEWTEEARRHHIQGRVLLSALFTARGQVRDVQVVRGLGYGLDEKAVDAARRIRFNPATDPGGRPISVHMTVAVDFRLL